MGLKMNRPSERDDPRGSHGLLMRIFFLASVMTWPLIGDVHAAAADLSASITANAVEVANATPGGDVVAMTMQLEAYRGGQREFSTAVVAKDDDRDGNVRLLDGRKTPRRSIFVIVDIATGRHVVLGGRDYRTRVITAPKHLLKEEPDGISGFTGRDVPRSHMLVVRPGAGAWRVAVGDGSFADGDKVNDGKVTLNFEEALAVSGQDKSPKRLKKGDIVAVIDPAQMEVFVLEIEQ